jgi:hypothetical protein
LLVDEGEVMRHCAGTYAACVAKGVVYLYRVLAPERATLCLVRMETGWRIDQLVGMRNQPIGPRCWLAVGAWLRASGFGCSSLYRQPLSFDEIFREDQFPY